MLGLLSRRCLVDDRGRRVPIVRVNRWWPVLTGQLLEPEVGRHVRSHITAAAASRGNGWTRRSTVGFATLVANICVVVPLYFLFVQVFPLFLISGLVPTLPRTPVGVLGAPSLGWSMVGLVGWLAVVTFVTALISTPFQRWYWNPIVVAGVLRERHCASCGYPLDECATASDGCTVCSECGAAWKMSESAAVIEAKS